MVEGHRRFALPLTDLHRPFLAHFDYSHHSIFQICHDGGRRDAKCCDMLRSQKIRSGGVLLCGLLAIMGTPIDFDCQSNRRAIEIEDVDTCRMLTPELETIRPLPENAPEHSLWKAHLAAQLARSFQSLPWPVDHRADPPRHGEGDHPKGGGGVRTGTVRVRPLCRPSRIPSIICAIAETKRTTPRTPLPCFAWSPSPYRGGSSRLAMRREEITTDPPRCGGIDRPLVGCLECA